MNITLSRKQLEAILEFSIRQRRDRVVAFSANTQGELWFWTTYGLTRFEDREDANGIIPVLDAIAKEYLAQRPSGGRFFVDSIGAYYKDEDTGLAHSPFVSFHCRR